MNFKKRFKNSRIFVDGRYMAISEENKDKLKKYKFLFDVVSKKKPSKSNGSDSQGTDDN